MARSIANDSVRRNEILDAATRLLAAEGYDGLTLDAVACEARASKASLYRHWGSKLTLVLEALHHYAAQRRRQVHPTLRDDLIAAVLDPSSVFHQVPFAAWNSALAGTLRNDDNRRSEIVDYFRDDPLTQEIWDRARERGEVGRGVDTELLNAGLFFGLFYLTLVQGDPLTPEIAARVVDNLILPAVVDQGSSSVT